MGAYAVSAYGSGLGFGALPLIAVLVLGARPAEVSTLSAVGPMVGALIAVPLAPWVEFRRKRHVMIAMDLTRFAAMAAIPVAYAFGRLGFVQLLVISAVVAAAKIAFGAASGAYPKALVRPDDLLVANARFESTNWSSIVVGPPLGGAAISLFGPVVTVVADALSYLLSALGIAAIRGREEPPRQPAGKSPVRAGALLDGWRHIMHDPGLRALYLNNMLVSGLIMATEPLLAVLLLRQLHFPPWQYALAFAAPCLGGLIGSRLARRVVHPGARHLPARTYARASRRPYPVGLVGRPAGGHRRVHRARRAARRRHRPAYRPCGGGTARPGHPAPASPEYADGRAISTVSTPTATDCWTGTPIWRGSGTSSSPAARPWPPRTGRIGRCSTPTVDSCSRQCRPRRHRDDGLPRPGSGERDHRPERGQRRQGRQPG